VHHFLRHKQVLSRLAKAAFAASHPIHQTAHSCPAGQHICMLYKADSSAAASENAKVHIIEVDYISGRMQDICA